MATEKPGRFQPDLQDQEDLEDLGPSLLSMENLDRTSPELWPEKIPGVTEFINSFQSTPQNATKLPYSREFTHDDENYLHQLASLSTSGLIGKSERTPRYCLSTGIGNPKK
ncbi:hypothetical protein JTB14_020874 [Gonioctena quinquepunctata]|nr:hypothetical protein JTB14_020874 [Gonioctena quinquepunctata]